MPWLRFQQHLHHVVFARVENLVAAGRIVGWHHVADERTRIQGAAFDKPRELRNVRVDIGETDSESQIARERVADWKIERWRAERADHRNRAAAARRHDRGTQSALV